MLPDLLFNQLLAELTGKLKFLPDKPEETANNTLRALWFAAAGAPKSAQLAEQGDLPKINPQQESKLRDYLQSRIAGVPLAHLTGRQQFMGIELLAGPEALVPRKETEILGRVAVTVLHELARSKTQLSVIDVCTGAGNLAVAYALKEPVTRIFASDLSADAVFLAKRNVKFHQLEQRVEIREGDLLAPFATAEFYDSMDLLSCNPPYISSAKVDKMHTEISEHEPRLAFDGGPFGIKIVMRLMNEAPLYLNNTGCLVFEVGFGQGPAMLKQLEKNRNYCDVRATKDEQGEIRVLMARRAANISVA
jgi:release factor glutamine methyltransferase